MSEPTILEVHASLKALREDVLNVARNSLTGEERKKINDTLDKHEDATQKAFVELKRVEGLEAEIEKSKVEIERAIGEGKAYADRLVALEAMIAQRDPKTPSTKAYRDDAEFKAIEAWIRRPDAVTAEQKNLMRTDVDTSGGYMVPTELDTELRKEIVETDPVRAVSRVKTIAGKAIEMVIRTDIPRAQFEGEAEEGPEDIGGYRLVTVTPARQTVTVPLTLDQIMNSAWNMDSEVMSDAAEGFAEGEGQGFVIGTGVKQPEGFTSNAAVIAGKMTDIDTAVDATFAGALIAMTGELKVGYQPMYALHRRTVARIRALRATGGEFLWQPGMNGGAPATLNGYPYIVLPSMDPWDTSGGDVVVFADFRRGYLIVDRVGLSMVRDEVTQARKAIVKLTLHRWLTGLVVMPEAFKLQRKS
jgi:HK97 family phage major capsid protein